MLWQGWLFRWLLNFRNVNLEHERCCDKAAIFCLQRVLMWVLITGTMYNWHSLKLLFIRYLDSGTWFIVSCYSYCSFDFYLFLVLIMRLFLSKFSSSAQSVEHHFSCKLRMLLQTIGQNSKVLLSIYMDKEPFENFVM